MPFRCWLPAARSRACSSRFSTTSFLVWYPPHQSLGAYQAFGRTIPIFVPIGYAWGLYGRPPLDIAGYPLWWAAFDGSDVILGGAVVLLLLPRLKGRGMLCCS
jgi:hypothetical protein